MHINNICLLINNQLLIQLYNNMIFKHKKDLPTLAAQAIGQGAYGGGREGVQRAEYQNQSDLNRALLQAQLQQQGFGQAQQLAANQYTQQLGLGQAQQGFLGGQIAGLSTLGAQQQAQRQAELSAQQQLAYQQAYQPLQAAQIYGAGIQPLISGYPGQNRNSTNTISNCITNCIRSWFNTCWNLQSI